MSSISSGARIHALMSCLLGILAFSSSCNNMVLRYDWPVRLPVPQQTVSPQSQIQTQLYRKLDGQMAQANCRQIAGHLPFWLLSLCPPVPCSAVMSSWLPSLPAAPLVSTVSRGLRLIEPGSV